MNDKLVREQNPEMLVGIPSGGLWLATWVGYKLKIPVYPLPNYPVDYKKRVVLMDVLTTGGSVLRALDFIKPVVSIVVLVNRSEPLITELKEIAVLSGCYADPIRRKY